MPIRTFKDRPTIGEYKSNMKSILATTRFNNKTYQENRIFLETTKDIPQKVKCLYNCSIPIASTIPVFSNLFVLEMNNETNQIMGIGLIKNQSPEYNKYPIYSDPKYNQYSYQGSYRIDRSELTEPELAIVRVLEAWCFRGRRHLKRLQGIKAFPYDILYDHKTTTDHDIVIEIADMFKTRFLKKGA
jgi:hypothetical protein